MKLFIVLLMSLLFLKAHAVEIDLQKNKNLVDLKSLLPDVEVDFKYATSDNFTKKNLYGDFKRCLLQREAAEMLIVADKSLKKVNSQLRFRVFDCLRPRSVQKLMWETVKGTKGEKYVANPYSKTASIHNYGCALDLTLALKDKGPLDMGTPFDYFGEAAHPKYEVQLLNKGKLTVEQLKNRVLLRYVMTSGGFRPISNEWWHFNCKTNHATRSSYKIVE